MGAFESIGNTLNIGASWILTIFIIMLLLGLIFLVITIINSTKDSDRIVVINGEEMRQREWEERQRIREEERIKAESKK